MTFTAGAVNAGQSTVSSAPASVVANGVATSTVTVTARDIFGNPVGGQAVSLAQGGGASTIVTVSGTTNASGVATFSVTDATVQTVTYTATIGATPIPQTAQVAFVPGAATHFSLTAPGSATAGTPFSVTVTARDATNNVVTGYTGTVTFSSSDAGATLPSAYAFVAGDNGSHTFVGATTLTTAGSRTVSVGDGTSSGNASVNVGAAVAHHVTVTASSPQTAGAPFAATVTAKDVYGNVATGYLGTVHFTSSDPAASLPLDYSFVGGDAGSHTFAAGATLRTAGTQTIAAADTIVGSDQRHERLARRPPRHGRELHRRSPGLGDRRSGVRRDGHREGRVREHRHGLHRHGLLLLERRPGRAAAGDGVHGRRQRRQVGQRHAEDGGDAFAERSRRRRDRLGLGRGRTGRRLELLGLGRRDEDGRRPVRRDGHGT